MKFTPSPTKLVAFINKEGGKKLVPMNRAARRKLGKNLVKVKV